MIRNLIKKTDQKIHKATIFLIWRKIITYANILEQDIAIGLLNSEQNNNYQHYIKEYYNNFIDIQNYNDSEKLILDINENKIKLAIFPLKDESWWIKLLKTDNKFHIFAKIPFLKYKENHNQDSDLFIAAIKDPEQSENDKTLLAINSNLDFKNIENIFNKNNAKFTILKQKITDDESYNLVQIDNFYTENEQLIIDLNHNSQINAKIIGYYATEINI